MDGDIYLKYVVKNGDGSIAMYHGNGNLRASKPIKNYKFHGTSKTYTVSGKLYAIVEYRNSEPVSGRCANKRENGAEWWSKEELYDWEYALRPVDCGNLYDLEEDLGEF